MAYSQPPDAGEIRATLALSQAEAQMGSSRTLNLPGGRRITVSIPPGVYNGQELRVAGQGEPTWQGGPAGDLLLTISIAPEPVPTQYNAGYNEFAPTEAYSAQSLPQNAPPPPGYAPSNGYPPTPAGGISPYTAYPPQPEYNPPMGATQPAFNTPQRPQDPLYLPQNQAGYQPPSYPGLPGYTQPGQIGGQGYPPPAPRRRRLSPAILTLIVILVLLLLAGSGLIYYVGVYQPKVQHDQATATAQAQLSATANAQNSATALANATANAIASATANAQATATAQASATAAALQNILTTATSGNPTGLNDTLNAQSSTSNWDILAPANSSVGGSCQFTNGAYHSNMPAKGYFQPCYATTPTFANFAFQVQMTIIQGDEGGILFRANPNNSTYYLFRIDTNGAYDLFVYSSNQASSAKRLLSGTAQGFKTGLNQSNTLALVARGSNLYFYANGQYIDSASDNTFTSGKIGVFGEDATNPTDAAFTNAQVWQL